MLKPREVTTKLGSIVQIYVEGEDINKRKLQIFRRREVGVRNQSVRVTIFGNGAQVLKECFDFFAAVPQYDWRRYFLPNAIHQYCRMLPTREYTFLHFPDHLLANLTVLQEADILHPGNHRNHTKTVFQCLIQERKWRNSVCQDRIDFRLPHQCKVDSNIRRLGKFISIAVRGEGTIRHSLYEELLIADHQKFPDSPGLFDSRVRRTRPQRFLFGLY